MCNNLPNTLRSFLSLILLLVLSNLQAQPKVHEEPYHPPIFQNGQVRILNAQLPPGDTTQYHLHHTPSVFIFLTATNITSQLKGGQPVTSVPKAGSIVFEDCGKPNEKVHRVWNNDKDSLHVIDIELFSKDTGFVQKALIDANLKLEVDTAWARVYRLNLSSKKTFLVKGNSGCFILVSLGKATVQTEQNGKSKLQQLKRGSFIEIKSKDRFSFKNIGIPIAGFVLVELPVQAN